MLPGQDSRRELLFFSRHVALGGYGCGWRHHHVRRRRTIDAAAACRGNRRERAIRLGAPAYIHGRRKSLWRNRSRRSRSKRRRRCRSDGLSRTKPRNHILVQQAVEVIR